jgi:hypothetical protein
MKEERTDIKFPIWRKKVDKNLLKNSNTPIPNFFVSFGISILYLEA